MNPKIAISMGDPAGVGPEVVAKTLADTDFAASCKPLVVGSYSVMCDAVQRLGLDLDVHRIHGPEFEFSQKTLPVLELADITEQSFEMGVVSPWCGDLSYRAVAKAVELCLAGVVDAMVTAPISKEAWHRAGHYYDGHTGLLAELTKCDNYRMTFASETLNVMLSTTHIPLCQVCRSLTVEKIGETIRLGYRFLQDLGVAEPKIAVCGVNPHAGEAGIFGNEEERLVSPAVSRCQTEGISVVGPIPADTVFLRAVRGEFDLVIAHYHDQGLIPIKLVAFDSAVNISVGLPIIRTSVDHGTAFDIAGRGIADHRNMGTAIGYAVRMAAVCNRQVER